MKPYINQALTNILVSLTSISTLSMITTFIFLATKNPLASLTSNGITIGIITAIITGVYPFLQYAKQKRSNHTQTSKQQAIVTPKN